MNLNLFEKILENSIRIREFEINGNKVYLLEAKFLPSGSIKIIPAYRMLKKFISHGNFSKEILEASSGNTAIALAFLGKIFGFKVNIVLPQTTSEIRKKILRGFGVNLIEVDGTTDFAVKKRDEIFASNPEKYFVPDQFQNWENFNSHYFLTANIIQQKIGAVDFFVGALGTSGTLLGTGKKLKEQFGTKIVALNPIDKIEGLRNFKTTDLKISFFEENKNLIDFWIDVNFSQALEGKKELEKFGIYAGLPAGVVWKNVFDLTLKQKNQKIVGILTDGAENYV